nr:hypothetical protein [Actinomadura rifamycini]
MLDEVFGGLRPVDASLQFRDVALQCLAVVHRVRGGQQRAQFSQREAGLLAHEDQRDAFQVGRLVRAPTARASRGFQQAHALPVPQYVRGEPEPFRELTDGQPIA